MQVLQILSRISLGCVLLAVAGAGTGYPQTDPGSVNPLEGVSAGFEDIAKKVSPGVAQVFALGLRPVPGQGAAKSGMVAARKSTGSGVLVDPNGYLVTNAHLVAGAKRIKVLLIAATEGARVEGSILRPGGRLFDAKLLGYDLETDVAVLKVEAKFLRFLKFGDSDELRKGQLVFAFGNPGGLNDSVSMGVVSSVGRQLRPEDPMIYIQTDASIKASNDGGPLVNTAGQVIGINNYAVSQTEAKEGFGFAGPSNIVRAVYEQIRETGRVRRGVVGVSVQTITPLMAESLDLPRKAGVIVADIRPGSPANQAGIHIGDIILTLDGKVVENARQFNVNLYQRRLGDTLTLEILRGGEKKTVSTRVVERYDDVHDFLGKLDPSRHNIPKLGIMALDVDREIHEVMPILRWEEGVIVVALSAERLFGFKFRPGDVIHSLNGSEINNLRELQRELKKWRTGDVVVMQVEREGELRYAAAVIH